MKRENTNSPLNAAVFLVSMAMVAALILPTIARHRTAARQAQCSENLIKIGLGIHNYHSAYKQLPTVCGGTTGGETDESCNQGRLGMLVGLLPFIEQQKLWETIINPYVHASGQKFPSMGPVPWYDAKLYQPWGRSPDVFQCPERAGVPVKAAQPKIVYTLEAVGQAGSGLTTNYVANFGDGIHDVGAIIDPKDHASAMNSRATQRGMFIPGRNMKFRDILDGLANTIMMSETRASVKPTASTQIAKNVEGLRDNPSICLKAGEDPNAEQWDFGRGSRWCDGALPITGFQTVLPPNSPSCTSDLGMFDGVLSASSDHDGGVHALFGDGRVSFITNSIEAGDPTIGGVNLNGVGLRAPGNESPYGLWGALGTRASKERIEQVFPHINARPRVGLFPAVKQERFVTWTDKTGEVTLSAKFVRIIDQEKIELEDTAGIIHQVPLNTLSDKDIFRAVSQDLLAK